MSLAFFAEKLVEIVIVVLVVIVNRKNYFIHFHR